MTRARVKKSRLVRLLGEEEAGLLIDRLFAGALTTVDCILIEWLLQPRGRRKAPKVVREQVALRRIRVYKKLRAREGHDGLSKHALADMPDRESRRTITRARTLLNEKRRDRVVEVTPEADD
jgi:hypothetical protein